jgi:hypothetical protein
MEECMFYESMEDAAADPSFLYLMLAATYFRQASRSRHSHVRRALRDLGREYLMKSHGVSPTHPFVVVPEMQSNDGLARLARSSNSASRREAIM